jgi:hypothetical protein
VAHVLFGKPVPTLGSKPEGRLFRDMRYLPLGFHPPRMPGLPSVERGPR